MAQLIVRNLDDAVKVGLQLRASRHGHSMEAEARDILQAAVAIDDASASSKKLGTRIANMFRGQGLVEPLEEMLRGEAIKPASFD